MKLQYLGDSKDRFKWDYHDYLTSSLGYDSFNILPMLTPDDKTTEGSTKPDWFPAREGTINFCNSISSNRKITNIKDLPKHTGSNYSINLHNSSTDIKTNRSNYYSDIPDFNNQVVFIDPDNGFEPEKSCSEKHVKYSEIPDILNQISDNSCISVFHHFRRITFTDDFNRIKESILSVTPSSFVSAIYWHQLMFVQITQSEKTSVKISNLCNEYSASYPVNVI
ncbi:MAG: hypothetical protein DRR42_15245 [Gammaproteobacteria bacterium]|nr:MAG: hypothetical protein DRR42_15245 [Gammaproteobacteria bacterium]